MAKVQMGERPLGQGGTYTAAEIDALLAGIAGGGGGLQTVDLSAYAKTEYVDATKTEIIVAVTPALAERYTKSEVDGLVAGKASQTEFAQFQGYVGSIESANDEKFNLLNQGVGAANTSLLNVYTKAETDAAIADSISGQLTPAQVEEIVSQVGPVDLTAYAKREDSSQNIVAGAVVANGFVFGSSISGSNTGLVYTDTGEGYGPRLVLGTPAGNELIPYQSDFAPIKSRLEALEVKAPAPAAAVDLSTAKDINDPALADFKASVMAEVRRMMAGGKTIPADVPWTKLLNTGSTVAEAKVLNGVVHLRGIITKGIGAGYIANVSQLPPTIPPPPGVEWVVPLACKNTSPAVRAFGYATFQANRQIGVSCDQALNTVWLDGISYPAYE